MYYGYRCYTQDGQPIGWLYTYNNDTDLAFTTTNFDWCKRWKTEKGVTKNFDYYNRRWHFQSKGGYLEIEVMPEVPKTESFNVIHKLQQETEQSNTIYKIKNQTKKPELGYFEHQALVERLVRRFAALDGYNIEPDVQVLKAEYPGIKMWVAMAEAAIEEMENQ
jgi:hypothetical protein